MKIFETQCLLLRNVNLTETDKVVTCLTKDYGVVKLVAKGARRLKTRFSGKLEPFTVAEVIYTQREDSELGYIRQIELEKSYFHLAKRLEVLAAFAYFAELLAEFAPPHEPNENLYRMARACFAAISGVADHPDGVKRAVLYFELWLLRLGGFLPELNFCAECRREFSRDETLLLNNNRFLCLECGERKGTIVSREQSNVLRLARRVSPDDFVGRSVVTKEVVEALSQITRRLIKQVLLRDPVFWTASAVSNGEQAGL